MVKYLMPALIFGLILWQACNYKKNDLIVGSWQAIEVLEEGKPLQVNTSDIRFFFGGDESYQYFSTLNYREAGSYYVESKYLFTTDTLNKASREKAVEILKLTDDTLYIKMLDTGKERLLKLVKSD